MSCLAVGFQAQLQNHAGQEPREFHTVQGVLEKSLKRVRKSWPHLECAHPDYENEATASSCTGQAGSRCCILLMQGRTNLVLSSLSFLAQVTGSDQRVVISVASRTDVGVHAKGQAATFCSTHQHFESHIAALNLTLERNIAVTCIQQVPDAFNVAQSLGKLYSYRCAAWHSPADLDLILGYSVAPALLASMQPFGLSVICQLVRA